MPKIFVIGPNKCATGSLYQYFKNNGLKSVHWDDGLLAKRMVSNVSAGLDILTGYENFTCFLDFYWVTQGIYVSPLLLRFFIAEQYPDALYIVNRRDKKDWRASRTKHDNGSFAKRLHANLGADYNADLEYDTYFDIDTLKLASVHHFDLSNPNKFTELGAFLASSGVKVINETEVKSNVSANLYK
ncbi:hypothetical protein [Paraglaciecola sp.]|uniref:hypothetical protein n=1 Tax=Paraglaciecola sp. TaxID=1920173 RepID=UPI003265A010